ncbi:hypothetical protein ACN28S_16020 [Cystobacter fuscus]
MSPSAESDWRASTKRPCSTGAPSTVPETGAMPRPDRSSPPCERITGSCSASSTLSVRPYATPRWALQRRPTTEPWISSLRTNTRGLCWYWPASRRRS